MLTYNIYCFNWIHNYIHPIRSVIGGNFGGNPTKLDFSSPSSLSAKAATKPSSSRQLVGHGAVDATSSSVSPIVKGTSSLSFDAAMIKKAATAASTGNPSSLLFTRTPVLMNNIIVGVITLVQGYNQNSPINKQFWGFKPNVIKQILKLFCNNSEFKIILPFVEPMEFTKILSRHHSREQTDVLVRTRNGVEYPYEALTFVINSSRSVASAPDLYNILTKKVSAILMHTEFRKIYQQMCEASAELVGLGKAVKTNPNFWNAFKRVDIVDDLGTLDKIMPDEDIVKLVSAAISNDVPNTWPP